VQAAPIPSVILAKGDIEEAAAAPALWPLTRSCTHSPCCCVGEGGREGVRGGGREGERMVRDWCQKGGALAID